MLKKKKKSWNLYWISHTPQDVEMQFNIFYICIESPPPPPPPKKKTTIIIV